MVQHGSRAIFRERYLRAAQDRRRLSYHKRGGRARRPASARTPFNARIAFGSDKTQRRLREMTEIVNKVEPRFGSALMAYAWYRSEPLPGFSGQTAMQLVRGGRADEVLDYIDAVDAGIHA